MSSSDAGRAPEIRDGTQRTRASGLARLGENDFDVLVIGGGITGAGIARDAALRGLRVVLFEKHDFGSGTTAGSTRLIHGGLRYLEMLDFRLVRMDLRERETLLRIAPHLVKPLEFIMPFYGKNFFYRSKMKIGMEYALKRSGPMSMAPSQLGAFTRSAPDQPYPNIEYHVQPLSLDAFGEPLHDFDAFTASVCNLNPTSRGWVRIRSNRFEDPPAITMNYLSTPEDRKVAADSLRVTRRIAAQPALAPYKPQEWRPGPQYQGDDELARLAGDIATTIFHPVGTTKMGAPDDRLAVLDSQLRVRGVAGRFAVSRSQTRRYKRARSRSSRSSGYR